MSLLWHILYYGWFVGEVLILVVTRTRRGDGNIRDRGSMLLLWIVISGAITVCKWVEYSMPANMFGGAEWLGPVSVLTIAAGLAIRATAVLSLGRSFSANVAVHDDQHVHKTGLFAVVRHPSYLGLMIVFGAVGIHARNWYSLAIVTVLPLVALIYRMHVEEAALTSAFGQEYLDYCGVTKRLIPGIF